MLGRRGYLWSPEGSSAARTGKQHSGSTRCLELTKAGETPGPGPGKEWAGLSGNPQRSFGSSKRVTFYSNPVRSGPVCPPTPFPAHCPLQNVLYSISLDLNGMGLWADLTSYQVMTYGCCLVRHGRMCREVAVDLLAAMQAKATAAVFPRSPAQFLARRHRRGDLGPHGWMIAF